MEREGAGVVLNLRPRPCTCFIFSLGFSNGHDRGRKDESVRALPKQAMWKPRARVTQSSNITSNNIRACLNEAIWSYSRRTEKKNDESVLSYSRSMIHINSKIFFITVFNRSSSKRIGTIVLQEPQNIALSGSLHCTCILTMSSLRPSGTTVNVVIAVKWDYNDNSFQRWGSIEMNESLMKFEKMPIQFSSFVWFVAILKN